MNDYITREAAINAVGEAIADGRSWYDALLRIPATDVKPIVKGEWIFQGVNGDWNWRQDGRGICWREYNCSVCGAFFRGSMDGKTPKICPNCSADMQNEKGEE